MKNRFRLSAAALAAVMAMSCMTAGVSAKDSLETRDGIVYRVSESTGESAKYTGWATAKSGNRFYYKDGKRLKNTWLKVKGVRTFYLDSKGVMVRNRAVKIGGGTCSFDANGRLIDDKVSEWGITVKPTVLTREGIRLEIKRDKNADANEVTWGEEFGVQKLGEDGKWTTVETLYDWAPELSADDVLSFVEAGDTAYRTVFFAYAYGSLENGKYRVSKSMTHKEPGKSYTRTKKLYVEFEITDKIHHAECPPPAMLVNNGIIRAETFGEAWDAVYPDGEMISTETDCMHPLELGTKEFMPVLKAKAGDKISLSFITVPNRAPALGRLPDKPDSVTAERWTYDDWGNTSAKSESVEIKDLSFKAKKGKYIYYVKAKWDDRELSEPRGGDNDFGYTAGTVYYAFCVEAD